MCRPHAYRASAAGGVSVGRRVASHVLPVVLFSTALNIPKFWETELVSGMLVLYKVGKLFASIVK